ncbi:MAG: tRNA preQ1(34) S-adenosylmethionine ribosyltransferase-isomerase QueA [Gemmatimonadota bacterium]
MPASAAPLALRTEDFEYDLPAELVASRPAERRDASRLLVLDRASGELSDRYFADFPAFPRPGDALVLNDTRVFPARLLGQKPTGAAAEVFLLRPHDPSAESALAGPGPGGSGSGQRVWEALVRPGGKLKPGREVVVAPGFRILIGDSLEGGLRLVTLEGDGDPWDLIEEHGTVPLPPYMERPSDELDRERYQTVYADERGSVAAPTAGLHLTHDALASLEASGVHVVRITLHVGLGTFRPLDAERLDQHRMHSEWYRMEDAAAQTLNRVRGAGGHIWAVGTTSARVLETVAAAVAASGDESQAATGDAFRAAAGLTDLFIYPPYEWRGVDHLLTNFHLPRSSLLMLVCALAGRDQVLAAYQHAVEQRYRFYSYGDAMLVL